jgi:hypothetical protein
MTKTVNGSSSTFRIGATAREIGLTRRGIIVATKEKRVYDWLGDYLGPYEEPRYTVRHAGRKYDFDVLAGKQRMAMAFIEDCFFGERALGGLNRIHKQYPKLRVIVFSVADISDRRLSAGL